MSNLSAFLHPVQAEEVQEVIVSRRFLGEDGKPVPFKIRPLTQEENNRLTKQSMVPVKGGGRGERELNAIEYGSRVIVAATVEPDFRSEELCRAYGTMDPLEVPGKMLLVGEYNKLSTAIMALSGLEDDLEDQAKN